jgi:hypothetical protein
VPRNSPSTRSASTLPDITNNAEVPALTSLRTRRMNPSSIPTSVILTRAPSDRGSLD